MSRIAIRITPDFTVTRLDLDAPEGSYSVLSHGIAAPSQESGGMIEAVGLQADLTMWVNEEYRYMDFDPSQDRNYVGEALWDAVFGSFNAILGPVMLTGGADDEGEDVGLTEEHAHDIENMAAALKELFGNVR